MTSILLAGCGRMGGALLNGWLDRGFVPSDVTVIEPDPRATVPDTVRRATSAASVPEDFRPDVVVLAVKPQTMAEAVPPLARYPGAVFLSIAAGRTLANLAALLGGERAIVRSMPNTPAAIGRGITVAVANGAVSAAQRAVCQELLAAVGEVAWAAGEDEMDAVTALSGSGPAYVFLLAEALAAAGKAAGLPDALAERLALVTVAGAGELLHRSADGPAALRAAVTSPGGTTAAALAVLMAEDGLAPLMARAVKAAADRSRELAG